jgi:hypothetical protein
VSQRGDRERLMAYSIDDGLFDDVLDVLDTELILVDARRELERLRADILGVREQPIVGLALDHDGAPTLTCGEVRAVVGAGVRIYLLADEHLLRELRDALGPRLALEPGTVRVWWPGAGARCDPDDHPAVLALDGEPSALMLDELAQRFDLTRPRVRAQVKLVEDSRALAEHELTLVRQQSHKLHERLRDVQIECHALRIRAQAAEASLAAAQRRR